MNILRTTDHPIQTAPSGISEGDFLFFLNTLYMNGKYLLSQPKTSLKFLQKSNCTLANPKIAEFLNWHSLSFTDNKSRPTT